MVQHRLAVHVQDVPSSVARVHHNVAMYRLGTTPRDATAAVTTVRVNRSARGQPTAAAAYRTTARLDTRPTRRRARPRPRNVL